MTTIATTIAGLLLTCASVWAADLPVDPERKDDPTGAQKTPVETVEQRDARMKWWREAKFGMFIHWGLYAVPAGTWNGKPVGDLGEWIMKNGKIPAADYAGFAAVTTAPWPFSGGILRATSPRRIRTSCTIC